MSGDLEEILDRLGQFGNPHLNRADSGKWWCYLKVFVTGPGFTVKVESEFKDTAIEAAREAEARLFAMFSEMTAKKTTIGELR